MIVVCKFNPSLHAQDQMIERGISRMEAVEALLKGVKRIEGRRIIALYRKIEVVYKTIPCHYFVITAYRK